MKKHIIICKLIACIGLIISIFVTIYTNYVSQMKFEYPILFGLCTIVLLCIIRLDRLKKQKDELSYYFVCLIMFICFVVSIFDLYS